MVEPWEWKEKLYVEGGVQESVGAVQTVQYDIPEYKTDEA